MNAAPVFFEQFTATCYILTESRTRNRHEITGQRCGKMPFRSLYIAIDTSLVSTLISLSSHIHLRVRTTAVTRIRTNTRRTPHDHPYDH
jgi:hypothetical protein